MNFIKRSVKFIVGFFLFVFHSRKLDLGDLLRGKRVAIVGAANSSQGEGRGNFIDNCDYVIRINKAPFLLEEGNLKVDIGVKCDILFHSFLENGDFGGGKLDFDLYDRLHIKYVINPIPSFFGFRNTLNFYKKYLSKRVVYSLPAKNYKELEIGIDNFRPTIGMCALKNVLEADFSELFITGFTFFKTSYSDNYRNALQDVKALRNTMKDMKIHDPDREFREFLRLLSKNRQKKISMDPVLLDIIARETGGPQ